MAEVISKTPITKDPEPTPTPVEVKKATIQDVFGAVKDLSTSVSELVSVLKENKAKETAKPLFTNESRGIVGSNGNGGTGSLSGTASPSATITETTIFPVPLEYRTIINNILNQEFGVKVNGMADSPAFQLDIIVPDKYTSISAEHRRNIGGDIRTKVVMYEESGNGVREWAETVFNSFAAELKAMIVQDRTR